MMTTKKTGRKTSMKPTVRFARINGAMVEVDEHDHVKAAEPVPSWQTTFNSDIGPWYGHIDVATKKAKECGYTYVTWNGMVYRVEDNTHPVMAKEELA